MNATTEGKQLDVLSPDIQPIRIGVYLRVAIRGCQQREDSAPQWHFDSRDLGVFQQNVNRYENGTTPHTDFLITLATKEAVSLDWLLLGKGRMRKGR